MRTEPRPLLLSLALLSGALLAAGALTGCPRPATEAPRDAVGDALIPRAVIFGNAKKSGLGLSPSGKQISFLAPVQGVPNVWVQTIGSEDARPVTRDTYRGISTYFWTPDGESILYLQDAGGDENHRIYQVLLSSGEIRLLTPEKGVKAGVVAVSRHHPDTILISMNQRDRTLFDVYRLDLRSGKSSLDTENPGGVVSWVADFDLQVRAALQMDPSEGGKRLLAREAVDRPWKVIRTWTVLESGGPVAFTRDGRSIIALGNKGSDKLRLYTIDVSDAKLTEIYSNPKADLSDVELNPEDRRIEAVSVEHVRKEWKVIDPGFTPDLEAMQKHAGLNRFGIVSRSRDDKRWIVALGGPNLPARYYLYERPARSFKLLVDTRPDLARYRLSPMEPLIIRARDGLELVSYLTRPASPLAGKPPLVLFVHGGPWSRDTYSYDPWVQWLANRGYVVLQVNFRGSAGFGKAFLNAGNKEWGRAMQNDLTDAVRWAISNAGVDPRRVAIMGGSYGGYAALAGVAYTPDLYAAAVDIVGPSNIVTLLQSVPPYWKPMLAVFRTRVGDLDKDRAMLLDRSPLCHAHKIRAPLAVFQGANDPRVKIHESDQMVAAIRRRGGKVLYVVYPDEGHGFRREPNRMDFIGRAEAFLAEHLGGRLETLSPVRGSTAKIVTAVPKAAEIRCEAPPRQDHP
ncbi:MAG: S9 family peptidase [Polyangia bacterium]|jgi:dipeptidyl aminopeptidase/acylaminoacyl peptidase|nr:S9 family peptidase [Polyangia bacterium]